MPLIHRPGEAQVDFGYALAKFWGVLRKVGFFVMVLPVLGCFLCGWPLSVNARRATGRVMLGPSSSLEGVPTRISYDNSKVLVSKVIGPRDRKLTYGFFCKLQSHYSVLGALLPVPPCEPKKGGPGGDLRKGSLTQAASSILSGGFIDFNTVPYLLSWRSGVVKKERRGPASSLQRLTESDPHSRLTLHYNHPSFHLISTFL